MVSFQSSSWISLLSCKQHHTLHSLFLALLISPGLHTTHRAEGSSFQGLLFPIYMPTAETAVASSEQPQRLQAECGWWWWWCSVPKLCLTLWTHGLQHARLPCPSPSPGVCSNSHPLNGWCHPTISSSIVPFSSCLQSFPASGSFPVSQLFTSGG